MLKRKKKARKLRPVVCSLIKERRRKFILKTVIGGDPILDYGGA